MSILDEGERKQLGGGAIGRLAANKTRYMIGLVFYVHERRLARLDRGGMGESISACSHTPKIITNIFFSQNLYKYSLAHKPKIINNL